jgi:hypothetical protein
MLRSPSSIAGRGNIRFTYPQPFSGHSGVVRHTIGHARYSLDGWNRDSSLERVHLYDDGQLECMGGSNYARPDTARVVDIARHVEPCTAVSSLYRVSA